MPTFQVGLCKMLNGSLVDYAGATIEDQSSARAIERAKKWASSGEVEVLEDSWLQILHDGKAVASLKPGEF